MPSRTAIQAAVLSGFLFRGTSARPELKVENNSLCLPPPVVTVTVYTEAKASVGSIASIKMPTASVDALLLASVPIKGHSAVSTASQGKEGLYGYSYGAPASSSINPGPGQNKAPLSVSKFAGSSHQRVYMTSTTSTYWSTSTCSVGQVITQDGRPTTLSATSLSSICLTKTLTKIIAPSATSYASYSKPATLSHGSQPGEAYYDYPMPSSRTTKSIPATTQSYERPDHPNAAYDQPSSTPSSLPSTPLPTHAVVSPTFVHFANSSIIMSSSTSSTYDISSSIDIVSPTPSAESSSSTLSSSVSESSPVSSSSFTISEGPSLTSSSEILSAPSDFSSSSLSFRAPSRHPTFRAHFPWKSQVPAHQNRQVPLR